MRNINGYALTGHVSDRRRAALQGRVERGKLSDRNRRAQLNDQQPLHVSAWEEEVRSYTRADDGPMRYLHVILNFASQ